MGLKDRAWLDGFLKGTCLRGLVSGLCSQNEIVFAAYCGSISRPAQQVPTASGPRLTGLGAALQLRLDQSG